MTDIFQVLIYSAFAILPGIIWMMFYLTKDNHPEPKKTILKVFILGLIMAVPVFFIEYGAVKLLDHFTLNESIYYFIQYFIIVAITEELFKYFAFKLGALKSAQLDEPFDVTLYMIIAALGFATAENVILFSNNTFQVLIDPMTLSLVRFIGANFLHVLCSGIFGFYIAVSFYQTPKRKKLFYKGFLIAVLTHGAFDFLLKYSIIDQGGKTEWTPIIVLVSIILIVSYILLRQSIKKLKNLKSVCKI